MTRDGKFIVNVQFLQKTVSLMKVYGELMTGGDREFLAKRLYIHRYVREIAYEYNDPIRMFKATRSTAFT